MRAPGLTRGVHFEQSTFSAPEERCRRFSARLLHHVGAPSPGRVLDIGCGTGSQLLHLASALPEASLTGVDISAPAIELAQQRAEAAGLSSRCSFAACDYLTFTVAPQDLIVAYSTLQLIRCDSKRLFTKIRNDLAPGGLLINVMPYDCPYNRLLMRVRAMLAASRTGLTDELLLRIGTLLHRRSLGPEALRERVAYMYQPLQRLDGPALRKQMAEVCGLDFVACEPERHASVAQPKHRLIVSRRRD